MATKQDDTGIPPPTPTRPLIISRPSRPSVCIRRMTSNSTLGTLVTPHSVINTPYPTQIDSTPLTPLSQVRVLTPSPSPLPVAGVSQQRSPVIGNLTPVNESERPTPAATDDNHTRPLTPSGIETHDFQPEGNRRRAGSRSLLGFNRDGGRKRAGSKTSTLEYDHDLVHLLDVIDPEVSTLSTLTNLQNSLFVPDLGNLINRRATYNLTRTPTSAISPLPLGPAKSDADKLQEEVDSSAEQNVLKTRSRRDSINSVLSESRYAVLPHGVSLDGWSDAEKQELNDYVRHLMHSRRAKFKRSMKGFGQYVRKPLGLFVTVYATLITLFGLAWVLFLIGWINVGGKQLYIINVIDNVLVALFAIIGDGLAPFRTIDTYHMIYIAYYTHLTWNLRKKANLPALPNHNDLPTSDDVPTSQDSSINDDLEKQSTASPAEKLIVLSDKQQKRLEHHQAKFQKSHTFYKPHETETHFAFPVRLLIAIVVLLDFHSMLQIALGACTWSINYKVRPFALTTAILCCSITCNIMGGVLISIGDHRTRKKAVRERLFRQQLTEDAIEKMKKRREKERARNLKLEKDGKES